MIDISCEMCMDLIPLVRDGIASPDSEEAVHNHLARCANCQALYDGETLPSSDFKKVYRKIQRQTQIFSGMVLMFGLFFGLSLSGSGDIFYNILLMPVIGAIGYYLFRWKALYRVPVLLFVTHLILNSLGMVWQSEYLSLAGLVQWTFLYAIFAVIGIVIAGLMHFALRKED